MAATSDEPCNVFHHRRDKKRDQHAKRADVPAEQALAEHFGHAGLLAEPLQTAGGADHEQEARRHRPKMLPVQSESARQAQALPRLTERS